MCVRGVNRQIIEVVNTENETFEKAILFLRAPASDNEAQLKQKAEAYLQGISAPAFSTAPPKKKKRRRWLIPAAIAGVGVLVVVMIVLL